MKYKGYKVADCDCGVPEQSHSPDCSHILDCDRIDRLIKENHPIPNKSSNSLGLKAGINYDIIPDKI